MKIFDTQNKRDRAWAGSGFTMKDDCMILHQAAQAKHPIPIDKGKFILRALIKRRSGNGSLFLSIIGSSGKIYFKKNITVTKNSWTEFSFPVELSKPERGIFLHLGRDRQSFGTVEVGRIVIASEFEESTTEVVVAEPNRVLLHSAPIISKQQKKSIAIIIPYAIFGGAEVYLRTLISSIEDMENFDFTFLYFNKNANIDIENRKNIYHRVVGNLQRLEADLFANQYDVIVYYNSLSVYNGLLEIMERHGLSARLVEIYHSDFKWSDSLSQVKERRLTDILFVVSDALGNDISGDPNMVRRVLRVPIDLSIFKPPTTKNNNDRPIIGTVARLSREKNIGYVIDLAQKIPEFDFTIIGDGPMRLDLESKIKQGNLTNVKLLGYKKDLAAIYHTMDGFLLTSLMEGTPVTLLEAAASGVPIFTTPVGRTIDIVSDGVTGFFLTGNLEQDSKIIKNNIGNKYVVENARDFVIKNHDSAMIAGQFIESLYKMDGYYQYMNNFDKLTLLSGEYV